jgi:hypothetical protein
VSAGSQAKPHGLKDNSNGDDNTLTRIAGSEEEQREWYGTVDVVGSIFMTKWLNMSRANCG